MGEVENPNAKQRNEEKEGVEMSRKQREELEKQAARRRYEELHKAGKTDEAKADLARLAEVKKRREEAAKKKQEEEKSKPKNILAQSLKEAMGTDESRKRGDRSKKEKKDDKDEKDDKEGGEKKK